MWLPIESLLLLNERRGIRKNANIKAGKEALIFIKRVLIKREMKVKENKLSLSSAVM